MSKFARAAAPFLLVLSWCGRTRADAESRFTEAGTVSVGVERLAGFSFDTTDFGDTRLDTQSFALFAAPSPLVGHHALRFAGDVFVFTGLALGGSFALTRSATDAHFSNGQSQAMPQTTMLFVSARAGYALETERSLYFWPRVALGYARTTVGGGGADMRDERLMATLEAALVLTPLSPISISLAPAADLDLAHRTVWSGATAHPPKDYGFGFYAGAGVWF